MLIRLVNGKLTHEFLSKFGIGIFNFLLDNNNKLLKFFFTFWNFFLSI